MLCEASTMYKLETIRMQTSRQIEFQNEVESANKVDGVVFGVLLSKCPQIDINHSVSGM